MSKKKQSVKQLERSLAVFSAVEASLKFPVIFCQLGLDWQENEEVDYLLRHICYLSAIKIEQIAKNLWLEIKIPSHREESERKEGEMGRSRIRPVRERRIIML